MQTNRLKSIVTLCVISLWSFSLSAAVPAGYYHKADSCKSQALFDALTTTIGKANMLSYGSGAGYTWSGFYHTDRDSTGLVLDMYSNTERYQTDSLGVEGMHIEHSFPKSWWGAYMNNAYKDLNHLFPADGECNSTKNNLPLGEVCEPAFDNGLSKVGPNCFGSYTGRCFEPADEYKGDFARAYFYIITAYPELSSSWSSPMLLQQPYHSFTPWALDLLLKWHREDPVSEKELKRQEEVYKIQKNRNPFIDFPNLVEHLWGNDSNQIYVFPTVTSPYLVSPDSWSRVDFGVQMRGTAITPIAIAFEAYNLSDSIKLSIKNNDTIFSLTKKCLTVQDGSHFVNEWIQVQCSADQVGSFIDTLVVNSPNFNSTLYIPIKVTVVDEFMALQPEVLSSTSALLKWMNNANYPTSIIVLKEGIGQKGGDLFFSTYMEGSSWNKAIEIYNGTGKSVDLSHYSLKKQNNGNGAFMGNVTLHGMLPADSSYLLVHGSANSTLLALADSVTGTDQNSLLSFNGNDAVGLYHNDILIDMVGYENDPTSWGENLTLSRKTEITHPTCQFNLKEWNISGTDDTTPLKSHSLIITDTITTEQHYNSTGTQLTINNLKPNCTYHYSVIGLSNTLMDSCYSVNSVQFSTLPLEAPLALEASDIFKSQFTANWEDIPEHDYYFLDVFHVDSTQTGSWTINFDSIGNNGKPLPTGWSGTASGSYSSTTSSGKSPNSLAFKNNGEYLESDTTAYPLQGVQFMYRFPSSGSGSWLELSGYNGANWMRIDSIPYQNTSKKTVSYQFNTSDSLTALRWSYHKQSGNLAIDDIEMIFGAIDTTFTEAQTVVNNNYYQVTGLNAMEDYSYRVRAYLRGVYSEYSNTIAVQTNNDEVVVVPEREKNESTYYNTQSGICILNLQGLTKVEVYKISGALVSTQWVHSPQAEITLPNTGIYIIRLQDVNNQRTLKVIRW